MLKQISCDQFTVDGHPRGPIYFDKYSPIENREEATKKAEEAYTAFKNAGTYRYVPIVDTKRQFNENLKKLNNLNKSCQIYNLKIMKKLDPEGIGIIIMN